MQTATTDQKVIVRDGDGNFYAIPECRRREFNLLKEEQIHADHGSQEWFIATQALADEFSEFMKISHEV